MNEHKKPRGHKAHNDKDSILADTKNLLFILYPAIQRMPKIERIEGAPVEMKRIGTETKAYVQRKDGEGDDDNQGGNNGGSNGGDNELEG